MRAAPVRGAAALGALAVALVACIDTGGGGSAPSSGPTSAALSGTLRVAAAASLTDVFAEIGEAFEAANPGTDVVFDFGPSSGLAESITAGAPVDVFASADTENMDVVVDAGDAAGAPRVFAANTLEIAVPAGNPGAVEGLADLARDELLVGLCAADAPCGRLAREVLAAAGVVPVVDTDEPDVKALLTKVTEDELDVGIVYVTDVAAAGDAVDGIGIPDDVNVTTDYPVVRVASSDAADLADAFIAHLRSGAGAEALEQAGFTVP